MQIYVYLGALIPYINSIHQFLVKLGLAQSVRDTKKANSSSIKLKKVKKLDTPIMVSLRKLKNQEMKELQETNSLADSEDEASTSKEDFSMKFIYDKTGSLKKVSGIVPRSRKCNLQIILFQRMSVLQVHIILNPKCFKYI